MGQSRLSRRAVLKTAALGSAAAITAPYVSGVYAAGTLSLGCWDHWVPGANKALDKICKEVKKGHMPIPQYTWMHGEAKLTDADRKRLCDWSNKTAGELY